jgi:hypothetical protein
MPFDLIDLVAIEMGYGHLRPAHSLANFLGEQPILVADAPPLASPEEQKLWEQARTAYELLSRAGRTPLVGPMLAEILQGVTSIKPLYPRRDLSRPTLATRALVRSAQKGMGRGLAQRLKAENRTLITTFFGPAILSEFHGAERVYCIATDSDVNRVWASEDAKSTRVTYFAPTDRVRRRLRSYGVPGERIIVSGFPLPHGLVGGPSAALLKQNLKRRLGALDPKGRFLRESREEVGTFLGDLDSGGAVPHLVFAVGGAGAQTELAARFLPSLRKRLVRGKLRLTLVAGIRREVAEYFRSVIRQNGLDEELGSGSVAILEANTHREYFQKFDELLVSADVLWTKPSEISFYGALGLPLIFSSPVGSHETYNRRWAIHSGAAVSQSDPAHAGEWFWEMLKDGTLAGAAWSGYLRMPKFGLYRVVEEVLGSSVLAERLAVQARPETA